MMLKESCTVLSLDEIEEDIYSMWLSSQAIAEEARPGQFVNVYSRDRSRLLPRPISICETDPAQGCFRLVFRVAGAGTREFASLQAGAHTNALDVIGPLGNGFPLAEEKGKRVLLVGGGIGIPPMLSCAKVLQEDAMAVLGYRSRAFLQEEFPQACPVFIATEDGSSGSKGTVIDAIRENSLTADVIFACGPKPMLRAVSAWAAKEGIPCFVSLEERMACGIGACLGCVCDCNTLDRHLNVCKKRVCLEGPVFLSTEVKL